MSDTAVLFAIGLVTGFAVAQVLRILADELRWRRARRAERRLGIRSHIIK